MIQKVLLAAAVYFALVFGTGFVLGTIRVLFVVPLVGVRAAELIESPVMLLAVVLAARWVVRRFCRGYGGGKLLGVGVVAISILLAAEIAVGVGLRGMSFAEVFTDRDPVSGPVYFGLLGLFAVMPWVCGRAGGRIA